MSDNNDGVTDRIEYRASVHRIGLTLNRHGIARALALAGLIPDGYRLSDVSFPDAHDEDHPELNALVSFTLERETPT